MAAAQMPEEPIEFTPPAEECSPETIKKELEQSYLVVKKLLPFLAKRGIPISPKNFHIFYDFILFSNPDLNKTINELLKKNFKFSSQLSDSLYAFLYRSEINELQTRLINQAATSFMSVSDSVEESLLSAKAQTDHFQKVLADTSRQMAGLADGNDVQPFLDDLMTETEKALATGDKVAAKLKKANSVIAALKAELKNQTNLAQIDELTKLSNRRHLTEAAPGVFREALESGRPLSAIAFDIDHFKKINDAWGHNNGDKVLVLCSGIIKKMARSTDLTVRMGGEEFLLLCANLNLEMAVKVAERVRHNISTTYITVRGNAVPVTISGGVAEYVKGEDLTSLIGRADKALYQAKLSGRNRVCVAEPDCEPLIEEGGKTADESNPPS
jgi:diguanylate cyclase